MYKQKGQAILIILLIMAVILTIALSIVSRSVTDVTISQKEDEAARAYSAAEAGIERTLLSLINVSDNLPSGDEFSSKISSLADQSKEFLVPILMSSGETTPVWFVSHNQNGDIECSSSFPCFTGTSILVCWGQENTSSSSNTTPALELSILHTSSESDYSTTKVARAVFDPFLTRDDTNNFLKGTEGSCTIEDKKMQFSKTVNLSDLGVVLRSDSKKTKGPQIARVRLLYNTDQAHPVGIKILSQEGFFPKQGNKIESSGISGQATRKVQVYQLYPDLPPVFDYGIFSGTGGITK